MGNGRPDPKFIRPQVEGNTGSETRGQVSHFPFHFSFSYFFTTRLTVELDFCKVGDLTPPARGYDDITGWIAIVGPAGLPKDVAEKLSAATSLALQQPEVKNKLALFGLSPMPMTPEQLRGFIGTEIPKWSRMAKEAKIQPE